MALQRLFVGVSVKALLMSSPGSAIQYVFQGRDLGGSFCGGMWLLAILVPSPYCIIWQLGLKVLQSGSFINQDIFGI